MERLADTLLASGKAFSNSHTTPQVNPVTGGQMGFVPDLKRYVQNAAYVQRNAICLLMDAPRGFRDLPESETWTAMLKGLVETGAKSFDGLRGTLQAQFAENPFGGAGEIQEDISGMTRDRSQVSFVWTEKYGMPIWAFFDAWMRYLMMDPDAKVPLVTTLIGDAPADLLPDYTGASMLFIEHDPMMRTVVKAWLIVGMMPKTSGEYNGRRDITSPGQSVDYTIEFTGIQQVGAGVNSLAQQMLDEIVLSGANPSRRAAAISGRSADVNGNGGWNESITALTTNQV